MARRQAPFAPTSGARYKVAKITKSERKRYAPTPYSTSKLQQDAVNRLGFGAKRTMQVAQGLYEGVDLGKEAGRSVSSRTCVPTRRAPRPRRSPPFDASTSLSGTGPELRPPGAERLQVEEGGAGRARGDPPDVDGTHARVGPKAPEGRAVQALQAHLESLRREPDEGAVYDQTTSEIDAKARRTGPSTACARADASSSSRAGSRPTRSTTRSRAVASDRRSPGKSLRRRTAAIRRPGRPEKRRRAIPAERRRNAPRAREGEKLTVNDPPGVVTEQKFTQPPPRYTEGSLVRELEERGIGRPSTYAEIISKVQARDYVEKIDGGRQFRPTTLGKFVVDGLVESELDFMDPRSRRAWKRARRRGVGDEDRVALLSRFYKRFRSPARSHEEGEALEPRPHPDRRECATRAARGR
jgi:DNA topoisomerase-1